MSDWWWQSIKWELVIGRKRTEKKSDYFSLYKNAKKYFFLSLIFSFTLLSPGFPRWLSGKDPPAYKGDAGHTGSIPRSGRSPGGGHGNPLQYSCWKIFWTEEPGKLQSMGLQRVRHDWALTRMCTLPTNTFLSVYQASLICALPSFSFGGVWKSSVIMPQILLCFHSLSSLSRTQLHAY